MQTFSVSELLRRSDHVLGVVRHRGESVLITRRGRPVAMICPCQAVSVVADPAQAALNNYPNKAE